ncbi:MAG: DUF305 domain-containing protein [Ilumatobacteraceae bacterium]|nr:DUF305 domain-containing protein [Ilumatobacteraceae bacterium]
MTDQTARPDGDTSRVDPDDPTPTDRTERQGHDDDPTSDDGSSGGVRHYWRFGAMILTSMVAMFLLTYANSYRLGDARWSETRFFMTFVMGAAMAVIMLSFMLGMYRSKVVNAAIFLGSALVFVLALWLVRSQATVDDQSYMRAMIPHHSIAILTSSRADIDDVRVRELADAIIEAQKREIEEMNWLIDDIDENGVADTEADAAARPVPEFTPADYDD